MTMIENIHWVWPWAMLLLPLPALVYWLAPARKETQQLALRVPDTSRYHSIISSEIDGNRRYWLRFLLIALAWLSLVVACARPQSYGDSIGVPVSGRDLMLGIDISGSMREADLYAGNRRATRMAVVKQVASDFVARRTGDRVGLIMFGSQAYVQTPLTYDHDTVQHFLAEATVGLAGRSTAIGDAIGLGVKRLRDLESTSRVLILLTDGENSAGVLDPVQAANLAAQSEIRIHTIGVGADSRNVQLDEQTLKTISQATGGQYFRARNQQQLETIYEEIDLLEPSESDANDFRPLQELFVWPFAVAVLFSILWLLLSIPGLIPQLTGRVSHE